jgi:glycosyltransferase involved in cell wall biosynthesis
MAKSMKVLFATYPMAFHTPGGGEVQLLAYERHLPTHGVEVTRFDPWNPRFLDHDVVHFFSCMGGSSAFCAFVKQLELPLVVSSSLWITEETKQLYPFEEIRFQLGLADRVISNSDIECETLARVLDLPREKFVTVYNGIEDSFYQPGDAQLFRDQFDIRGSFILNVGNIEPRKNQILLAKAMKSLPDRKLVLIGHARDPGYLERVLDEGGEQIVYLGPIEHESPLLRGAYRACDVFALPSTLETPGLAALEAAAQGCRLVLTSEGSCWEYFGDYADYVAPSAEVTALAGALGAPCDGCNRKPLHSESKVTSWHDSIRSLLPVYQSLRKL